MDIKLNLVYFIKKKKLSEKIWNKTNANVNSLITYALSTYLLCRSRISINIYLQSLLVLKLSFEQFDRHDMQFRTLSFFFSVMTFCFTFTTLRFLFHYQIFFVFSR